MDRPVAERVKLAPGQAVAVEETATPGSGVPLHGAACMKVTQPINPRGALAKVADDSLATPAALAFAVVAPPDNISHPPLL